MKEPQTPLEIELHLLHPLNSLSSNYLTITTQLTNHYPFLKFKSFSEMVSHPKPSHKIYRILSKQQFLAHNEAIRRLSFAENRFIVIQEIEEQQLTQIPKDLEHYIRIITKDFRTIEGHIEEYLRERNRVQLPEKFVMCFNEKSYLEGFYLLLKVFDQGQKVSKMKEKEGRGKENKLVFVVEIRGFAAVYQMVRAEYNEYQFGFVILSDYGVKEDLERKYSESCECEVRFFVNKQSVSNYLLGVVKRNYQEKSSSNNPVNYLNASMSIKDINSIYNIGDLQATEEYLSVHDVWGRKTLKQALFNNYQNENTMLILKQERIPELALIVTEQTNVVFIDKSRVNNKHNVIEGIDRQRVYLLIVLNQNTKDILNLMGLLQYQKQNIKQLTTNILKQDADSQRVRKLEKVVFRFIPLIKFFSYPSLPASIINQIQNPQLPNILYYSHSNYQGHTNNKDYIILNHSNLNGQIPSLSSQIIVINQSLSDDSPATKSLSSIDYIQIKPNQLPMYLKKQTGLIDSLKQSIDLLKNIGIYSYSSGKQPTSYNYFIKKLQFDLNSLNQKQIALSKQSIFKDLMIKLSSNKKQFNIIIIQHSLKSIESQLSSLIHSKGYQNVYLFSHPFPSVLPIQQTLSLEYKFLHHLVQTSISHTAKRELNSPDYIHIRIFSTQDFEIISFIEHSISKRKLFKYQNSDEFYKVLSEFKSDIKEVIVMKAEDWREDMEDSIQRVSISHLINVEVILIYTNGAYVYQGFRKEKSKPQFLPEAQLKQKIEGFRSVKDEEKEEKKEAEVLQRELQELLRKQAMELDREFDGLSSNGSKKRGEMKNTSNHFGGSEYLFVNDSRSIETPVCMIASRQSNTALSSSLTKTQHIFPSNMNNISSIPTNNLQIASVENLLIQSGIYDDYDMKPPSTTKFSTSTAKPKDSAHHNPNSNKIQKNLLKKNPKKSSSKESKHLASTQKLMRSKSSFNSIKIPTTLMSFKSSKQLAGRMEFEEDGEDEGDKTISIEDKKRWKQLVEGSDKLSFLVFKKATPVEQTLRCLMIDDPRIQYKTFSKVSNIVGKQQYFKNDNNKNTKEQTVVVIDKQALKKTKVQFPDNYIVMYYNSSKKKSSSIRSFNFQIVYDVSIFLSQTMKLLVNNNKVTGKGKIAKGKRESNNSVKLPFYVAYNEQKKIFYAFASHLKEQYNCQLTPYSPGELKASLKNIDQSQIVVIISQQSLNEQIKNLKSQRENVHIHIYGSKFQLKLNKEKQKDKKVKTEKILKEQKQLKRFPSDKSVKLKKVVSEKQIKTDFLETFRQKFRKPQQATTVNLLLPPQSNKPIFKQSDLKIQVVSSFIIQQEKPFPLSFLTNSKLKHPTTYPFSISTIYIFSSIKISSLAKTLESQGFYPIFLRPQPSSEIIQFAQLLNPTEFIIVNQEQEQNYNKPLLSKIPQLIINSSFQSLKTEIDKKITHHKQLLPWNSIKQINLSNPIYYNPILSTLIEKYSQSNKYQYLSFSPSSISQPHSLYLTQQNSKYKLYILSKTSLQPIILAHTSYLEELQSTLYRIQNTSTLFQIPFIDSAKYVIVFYESEFGSLVEECSAKVAGFKGNIITSEFYVKDFKEITKLLVTKGMFGVFITRHENITVYNNSLIQNQSNLNFTSHLHLLPLFITSKSQIPLYKPSLLKLFTTLLHHHHTIPLTSHKHQFQFISNGIEDLFEMQQQVQTNLNLNLLDSSSSRSSLHQSRLSRSSEKSLGRLSSSRSKYSLLNKNRSNVNELVVLTPENIIDQYSLDTFITKTHKSIDLIPYFSMQNVSSTIRKYKKNQQYLIIFSHYSRLSNQIQSLITNNKMIVVSLSKKPYQHLLKSSPNFIYCSSQTLILTLSQILQKLNQKSSPINAIINSQITQLITFKTEQQQKEQDLRHCERFNICYPNSDLLKTEYKKEQYYFVSCKEGEEVDKRILRKNVYVFRDVNYLKYALFRVLKNYFLVKLKQRKWKNKDKERIVLPNKNTTSNNKQIIFLTERTSLQNINSTSFIVAPRSRQNQLSRFSNKTLFYENKQQLTITQNLLKFRLFYLKAEETLPQSKKVIFYCHQSLNTMISNILKGNSSQKLSLMKFKNVGEISLENNLKISIIICRIEEVNLMIEFLDKSGRKGFKLIVLNFEQNKRLPIKESLQVPIILNKEEQLARYLAKELKLYYITVFLDKRLEEIKEELEKRLMVRNQIHLVTSLEMKNKMREITGIGFYVAESDCVRNDVGVRWIEVKGRNEKSVDEVVREMQRWVMGKQEECQNSYY